MQKAKLTIIYSTPIKPLNESLEDFMELLRQPDQLEPTFGKMRLINNHLEKC